MKLTMISAAAAALLTLGATAAFATCTGNSCGGVQSAPSWNTIGAGAVGFGQEGGFGAGFGDGFGQTGETGAFAQTQGGIETFGSVNYTVDAAEDCLGCGDETATVGVNGFQNTQSGGFAQFGSTNGGPSGAMAESGSAGFFEGGAMATWGANGN